MNDNQPSEQWLRKMADKEDECESVAAGCLAEVTPQLCEKIGVHAIFWFLVWLIGGVVAYRVQMAASQLAYDAGDLSAFAWRAFLPCLFPLFLMQSAYVVAPLAIVTELMLWIGGRWFNPAGGPR